MGDLFCLLLLQALTAGISFVRVGKPLAVVKQTWKIKYYSKMKAVSPEIMTGEGCFQQSLNNN